MISTSCKACRGQCLPNAVPPCSSCAAAGGYVQSCTANRYCDPAADGSDNPCKATAPTQPTCPQPDYACVNFKSVACGRSPGSGLCRGPASQLSARLSRLQPAPLAPLLSIWHAHRHTHPTAPDSHLLLGRFPAAASTAPAASPLTAQPTASAGAWPPAPSVSAAYAPAAPHAGLPATRCPSHGSDALRLLPTCPLLHTRHRPLASCQPPAGLPARGMPTHEPPPLPQSPMRPAPRATSPAWTTGELRCAGHAGHAAGSR